MQIIPAIDFKDGKVVNLKQGQPERATIYSDDPVGMADHWVSRGCERLHLVDLDGAFEGKPVNAGTINTISKNHPKLTIQLGGGIRSPGIIESYLKAGVDYLIIGTRGVQEPAFVSEMCQRFPGHIIIGLDGVQGMAAINGWKDVTDLSVKSLALQFEGEGIAGIVYTDIGKDGMMGGLNLEATGELANTVKAPIIASGGVTHIGDIKALLAVREQVTGDIAGVITGRAIYEGTLDLAEAIRLVGSLPCQ